MYFRNSGDAVPGPPGGLPDRYGRVATDLRCTYCLPAEGLDWLARQQLLSAGEIVRLVGIGVGRLGIRELRLTGGEPLVRADTVDIVAATRRQHPDLPVSLTTNAVGLDRKAKALKDAGLTRINVSPDSLHPGTFAQLTRRPLTSRCLPIPGAGRVRRPSGGGSGAGSPGPDTLRCRRRRRSPAPAGRDVGQTEGPRHGPCGTGRPRLPAARTHDERDRG